MRTLSGQQNQPHLELNSIVKHKDWWVRRVNLHCISRFENRFTGTSGGDDRLQVWVQSIETKLKIPRTGCRVMEAPL
jgi:hypothetical protein